MRKGEATRQTILTHAVALARTVGLAGLTIGKLADDLKLSKSGLFGHFQSKETLQIQVLESAAARFTETVIKPSLAAPRGVPRLSAIFESWLRWGTEGEQSEGGCLFVQASIELDDQPGPVRDTIVRIQRRWFDVIAGTVERGVEAGLFRRGVDPMQAAQDLYGIMLAAHFFHRLLKDPATLPRARASFASLVADMTAGINTKNHA